MCTCVTLLCGEVAPTPSDSQASASALVALPASVLDYDHHCLALYCRYCGSASAGLVLRIKPVGVVLSSITCFLDGTFLISLVVFCLELSACRPSGAYAFLTYAVPFSRSLS